MASTPHSLIERLRKRDSEKSDSEAWERLVGLYTPWLERALGQWRIPPADRPDLVQETLAIVVQKLPDFEHNGQTGAFRRWLRNIVNNRVRTYWRKQPEATLDGHPMEHLPDAANSELERLWEQEHDQYVIQKLLELVQPDFTHSTWAAFRLQVLGGQSAKHVAAALGITPNAALLAKSRVLRRLRTEAEGMVDDI